MNIGTQLEAPEGLGELDKGERYYFVYSARQANLVTLARFYKTPSAWSVALLRMQRGPFEIGLEQGHLRVCPVQRVMPPWLLPLDMTDFEQIDAQRPQGVHKHYRAFVQERFGHIGGLLAKVEEIFEAEDPMRIINAHAKLSQPRQHKRRIQLWFFAYICHGANIWALMAPLHNIGRWDRGSEKHAGKRFGEAGIRGRSAGFSAVPLAELICSAYQRHAALGKTMKKVYRLALKEEFGCTGDTTGPNWKPTHPKGEPFPSYGQFRYHVVKRFGLEQVQKGLYGDARFRNRNKPSEGRFTHSVGNLLERIEVDVFQVKERPVSGSDGREMPPLYVARATCAGSSSIVGVGFSFGSETEEAYRTMMFSMAISKTKLFQIVGLPSFTSEHWPMQGLPLHYLSDRGAGAAAAVQAKMKSPTPVRELAPSWMGQSKAMSESSHPRDTQVEGAPSHEVSSLDVITMVRREVVRAMQDNHTSSIGDRLIGVTGGANVPTTPFHAWKHLSALGRTAAVQMDFDEAVRTFLTPVEFEMTRDELRLDKRVYDAEELRASGLYERQAKGQSTKLSGYVFPLALRNAWVEVEGRLIELTACLPLRNGKDRSHVMLSELGREDDAHRLQTAIAEDHGTAAFLDAAHRFEQDTGAQIDSSRRVSGRARTLNKASDDPEVAHILGKRPKRRSA